MSNRLFLTPFDLILAGEGGITPTISVFFALLDSNGDVVFGPDTPNTYLLGHSTALEYSDTVSSIRARLLETIRSVVYAGINITNVYWLDDKGIL